MVLALSQLIQRSAAVDRPHASVRQLMPFMTLQRGNKRLAQCTFSQANRLVDLAWGDPHITHFSRESHQWHRHTHLSNHHYHSSHSQAKTAADRKAGTTQTDTGNSNIPPEKNHSPTNVHSQVSQSSSFRRITNNHLLAGRSTRPDRGNTLPATNAAGPTGEASLINHSLVFRPFFLNTHHHTQVLHHAKRPGASKPQGHPALLGLLNTSVPVYRYREIYQSLSHDNETPSATATRPLPGPLTRNRTPDSMPLFQRRDSATSVVSETTSPTRFNPGSDVYPSSTATWPGDTTGGNALPWQHRQMHTDHNSNVLALQKNPTRPVPVGKPESFLSMPPARLPHKTIKTAQSTARTTRITELSRPLTEKIEHLIEQKIHTETNRHQLDTRVINSFRTELKTSLKPEKFITDEMIRVLRKKLQKTIAEERFRLGMLA